MNFSTLCMGVLKYCANIKKLRHTLSMTQLFYIIHFVKNGLTKILLNLKEAVLLKTIAKVWASK